MEKKRVARYLLIILIIALITALVIPGFSEFLPFGNPLFGEEARLARYYACSLAICTRGCDDDVVDRLCVEYDRNKECETSCKQVCTQQLGKSSGKWCGKAYGINLPIETPVELKGCYATKLLIATPEGREEEMPTPELLGLIPTSQMMAILANHYFTEAHYIIYRLSERDDVDFPSPSEIMDEDCMGGTPGKDWGRDYLGMIFPLSHKKYGSGRIFIDDNLAREKFKCTSYDDERGYYECRFVGNLKISSFDHPDSDGCADIIFEDADELPTGGFDLWIEYEGDVVEEGEIITIPLEQEEEFQVFIMNNLEFDSSFTLKVEYPEGANCNFADGEDEVSIFIKDGVQDFKDLTCELTERGTYPIQVIAWDGAMTHSRQFNLVAGDFNLYIENEGEIEEETIPVGEEEDFDVYLENNLGGEVTFDLSITMFPDSFVGCTFDGTSTTKELTVKDGKTGSTTFTCNPTEDAVDDYTVTVIAGPKEYEMGPKSDSVKIHVPSCFVEEFKLEVLPNSVDSGDDFELKASGFSGCQGEEVKFSLDHPDLVIDTEDVSVSGDRCILDKYDGKYLTAQSPGTYTFYAIMDVNGEEHTASADLTINAGNPDPVDRERNEDRCSFSFAEDDCRRPFGCWPDLCDRCIGGWGFFCLPNPVDDCIHCADPQSCYNMMRRWSDASNLCCLNDKDYYCNGPECDSSTGESDVPCLSPDTNTHRGDADRTENIWWRGIDDARNVLVRDDRYATFKVDWCDEHRDEGPFPGPEIPDCLGGVKAPDELKSQTAECVSTGLMGQYACKSSISDDDTYTSWMFIRIAPNGQSRSVYGVKISLAFESKCHGGTDSAYFGVYLHEKNGDWFKIGTPDVGGYVILAGEWAYKTHDIVPSSEWSWNNIDAIFIGLERSLDCVNNFERPAYVDYVGLLTKDSQNTTFCTDRPDGYHGPSLPYYRIVDDGRTCYWDVDCKKDGRGWKGTKSTSIGAIDGFGCDCYDPDKNPEATCGKGYCISEDDVCYYDVECAHGGWQGKSAICGSDKECTSEGCAPI